MRRVIDTENTEGLPLSEAVIANGFIFVSGLVGFDESGAVATGGIESETHHIFRQLSDILEIANGAIENTVKVNVYLSDAELFERFNAVYRTYFPSSPPARISLVAGLTIDASVEIDFILSL